jgi:hypothetical protein
MPFGMSKFMLSRMGWLSTHPRWYVCPAAKNRITNENHPIW